MTKTVLYLHGFASSSLSEKAQQTRDYFRQHWPQIDFQALDMPYTPQLAMDTIRQALNGKTLQAVIGSSLGGFLATCLAEQYQCRACLINPAVAPHTLLKQYLGRYYHPVLQQHYQVTADDLPVLQQLAPRQLQQPQRYFVLLQTGDEVLDYRDALRYYQGSQIELQDGGDHSFVGYPQYLPAIARFCQLD